MDAQSNTDPVSDPNWLPGWAHQGPAFFPWHRELLLQFENDLQAIDSTVTIPYIYIYRYFIIAIYFRLYGIRW